MANSSRSKGTERQHRAATNRVWGDSPTSVFAARRDAKIACVATLALLAVSASPEPPRKTEAAPFLTLPPLHGFL